MGWPVTAETCSQISLNCNYCILFDVCCVLTVRNILHKFDNAQRDASLSLSLSLCLSPKKNRSGVRKVMNCLV